MGRYRGPRGCVGETRPTPRSMRAPSICTNPFAGDQRRQHNMPHSHSHLCSESIWLWVFMRRATETPMFLSIEIAGGPEHGKAMRRRRTWPRAADRAGGSQSAAFFRNRFNEPLRESDPKTIPVIQRPEAGRCKVTHARGHPGSAQALLDRVHPTHEDWPTGVLCPADPTSPHDPVVDRMLASSI
jgi:hypothetical protein